MPSPTRHFASNAPKSLSEASHRVAAGVAGHRYAIFLLLAAGGCAADLLSKYWVFQWQGMPDPHKQPWWIWQGYVGIETALNPGALFGLGAGGAPLFAGLSVVAFAGILFWLFVKRAAGDLFLTVILGLISGGILGNLYDRLGLWAPPGTPDQVARQVRDWILFRYGDFTWPNFNIADSLLVCGAIGLMWHALRTPVGGKDEG